MHKGVFFDMASDFKRRAQVGAAALTMIFSAAQAQDSAQEFALGLDDAASVPTAPTVDRKRFVDRLSFFSPAFTKHLGADGFAYNETNFGALLGVELNKNPNSRISTTAYAGGFKNSYSNFSWMANVAFETRRGLPVLGVKDALGAGVGLMAVHYPKNGQEYVVGPVPYIKLLTGDRPFSLQVGYIAVNDGKPSLTGGTVVLSFSSHLSSLFKWAKNSRARMNTQFVHDYTRSPAAQPFQPPRP